MATKGTKSVPIKDLADKRNITPTFTVTLSGDLLPIQIIYGGKITACCPRGFVFPKGFSISHRPRHWSNETETLKLINEIVNPYIVKKRQELACDPTLKAFSHWYSF